MQPAVKPAFPEIDVADVTATAERIASVGRESYDRMIPVLCAADARYAMPLAVTLVSAAQNLRSGSALQVWLVDGGITETPLAMLKESVAGLPIELNLVHPVGTDLRDLAVSHHISHTAYLRLLADRWVPRDLPAVIYLDSDLVVRGSLDDLWDQSMDGNCCMAVPDIACPWVDARRARFNYRRSCPYLAVIRPVPNYRDHGLIGDEPYFNSGVMVLNLQAWRSQRLGEQLLECLRTHRESVWCWDQYALNCVLADRWKKLPARWNVGAHAWEYPSSEHAPIDRNEFREMLDDPAIVHFTTEWKPWHFGTSHPFRQLFYEYLDMTAWKGWRPERPPFSLKRWWDSMAVGTVRQVTINWRRVVAAWPGPAGTAPR